MSPITLSTSRPSTAQARTRLAELRSQLDRALGDLGHAQQEAPAGVVGHAALEERVQRLQSEVRAASVALDAAEHAERNAPTAPAETDGGRLTDLDAAYAAAALAIEDVPDGPDHAAERKEAGLHLADVEQAITDEHRSRRRVAAADAERRRREQAAAAEARAAEAAEQRLTVRDLARQRFVVAQALEGALAELVTAVELHVDLSHRLSAEARAAGVVVPDPAGKALSAHLAGRLAAAGVRGLPHRAGDAHLRPWTEQEAQALGDLLPPETLR
jgi:hypothetical protein